jgi:hypothetical protein
MKITKRRKYTITIITTIALFFTFTMLGVRINNMNVKASVSPDSTTYTKEDIIKMEFIIQAYHDEIKRLHDNLQLPILIGNTKDIKLLNNLYKYVVSKKKYGNQLIFQMGLKWDTENKNRCLVSIITFDNYATSKPKDIKNFVMTSFYTVNCVSCTVDKNGKVTYLFV